LVARAATAMTDDDAITHALAILADRLTTGPVFDSPQGVKDYCRLKLGGLGHEEFGVLFLNSQHGLIEFESMFRGTLSQTSVYPREVVKRALQLNAGAVILTHNHPSGHVEPSRADEHITMALKSALALIDVRVLDHVVVSATASLSFAERGLL
jgi:DNA repair protein RadC